MSRNQDRLGMGVPKPQNIPTPPQQTQAPGEGFSFVVPTEFVELPSRGKYYPSEHPLHDKESVEIKQMTAKEEDMLTSRALLKKGVALDRVLESVIVDKRIRAEHLLVGDRNAIIVAMRVSGYGSEYNTQVTCPECGVQQRYSFNLNDIEFFHSDDVVHDIDSNMQDLGEGYFSTVLPRTEAQVTYRLLNGHDEKKLVQKIESSRKQNKPENLVTSQLYNIVVAVNESQNHQDIQYLIENMPSSDSRHLRLMYKLTAPNVDMSQQFSCSSCDHEQELEVPLTADFFWPDR